MGPETHAERVRLSQPFLAGCYWLTTTSALNTASPSPGSPRLVNNKAPHCSLVFHASVRATASWPTLGFRAGSHLAHGHGQLWAPRRLSRDTSPLTDTTGQYPAMKPTALQGQDGGPPVGLCQAPVQSPPLGSGTSTLGLPQQSTPRSSASRPCGPSTVTALGAG